MTPEEIKAAINKEVAEAIKPVATQVGTIAESIKGLPDLTKQVATLTEADSARTIAGKEKPGDKGNTDPAAAASAATGLTKEEAKALFAEMLKERDTTAQSTAQQQAAHEAWIKKHAPKLADNPLGRRLFAGAKTDEERKAILDEYIESQKALGVKGPDLGATAAGEGGAAAGGGTTEAKKAAALEAAKSLKPVTL